MIPESYRWNSSLKTRNVTWIWEDETGGYEAYYNFHKMIDFLKNNPSYLERFFDLYENTFYQTVSPRKYRKSVASDIVHALTIAYDDLYREGRRAGRENSLAIYSKMTRENRGVYEYFDFIAGLSELLLKFQTRGPLLCIHLWLCSKFGQYSLKQPCGTNIWAYVH
jgi:hypothetical protein